MHRFQESTLASVQEILFSKWKLNRSPAVKKPLHHLCLLQFQNYNWRLKNQTNCVSVLAVKKPICISSRRSEDSWRLKKPIQFAIASVPESYFQYSGKYRQKFWRLKNHLLPQFRSPLFHKESQQTKIPAVKEPLVGAVPGGVKTPGA